MIAVILASGRLDRLYTGLSLLVSVAADGEPARGLVTFEALAPLLDERLLARALRPDETPALSEAGRETFARSLVELRETAAELPECRIWACAAAVETTGLEVDGRLDGVLSTPRFLRAVAGARLVVV
jgi:peroxiredoxin family protein